MGERLGVWFGCWSNVCFCDGNLCYLLSFRVLNCLRVVFCVLILVLCMFAVLFYGNFSLVIASVCPFGMELMRLITARHSILY